MSWWNRQRFSLVRTLAPTALPLSIQEAKLHCRIDLGEDDTNVLRWIQAATDFVEHYQRRALLLQTWQLKIDNWPWYAYGYPATNNRVLTAPVERFWEIELPRPPLRTVTSVKYIDPTGTEQTWDASNYSVDTASEPGLIYTAYGITWPQVRPIPFPITIVYTAGYGIASTSVPSSTLEWMRLAIAAMNENRELESTEKLVQWTLGRTLLDCESLGDLVH